MRTIEFYRFANGPNPIEEFLDSLTSKQSQKVLWVLRLVEDLEIVPIQYFKKLTGTKSLWEVRIQVGNDIFRLLGFFESGKLLILTHGFAKKTQKTPEQDIALATKRMEEYLVRRRKQ